MSMAVAADRINEIPARSDRVLRHAGVDRLFHWLTAVSVLTLMSTGLLPHVGVQFDWVPIHWITGFALAALVIFHVLRSVIWRRLRAMWFSIAELRTHQVGKYSVAQKLMHHAMTVMVLCAVGTGLLMLKKINTPLLVRDPYLFDANTWGVIYFIHGVAALSAITLVIVHIYFGLIPENRMYLRAMITGWMSRSEQRARVAGIRAGDKHLT
ncbi:MAG TPA: cytochrome b/b6 domain-containing protein [Steroidobacteraceae bacterium]|jgi:cytochrome b subunit of formate dehydrogenase|nr:cytochrome b/b6 domain-containing protein [Steroidobacteraceae bacterium]